MIAIWIWMNLWICLLRPVWPESTNTKIPHMYYISVNGIKEMYNPLHESHEDSFVYVLNNNIEEKES